MKIVEQDLEDEHKVEPAQGDTGDGGKGLEVGGHMTLIGELVALYFVIAVVVWVVEQLT